MNVEAYKRVQYLVPGSSESTSRMHRVIRERFSSLDPFPVSDQPGWAPSVSYGTGTGKHQQIAWLRTGK
jgi:hypothetical protein